MKVIIVGGGKVGFYLAKTLIEDGYQPTLIEFDKHQSEYVANNLDIPIIHGDGTTSDVLKLAGAKDADALISVTGQDQNNLISCQIAKDHFNVKKTIAKVNNPKNADSIKFLGVDNIINTTENIARLFEREVDHSSIKKLMLLNYGKDQISEIELPENYKHAGKKISDLKFPEDASIVSITRGGATVIPKGNTPILSKDKLLLISSTKALHNLKKIIF